MSDGTEVLMCFRGSYHSLCVNMQWSDFGTSAALQPLTGKLYTYLSAKNTFLFFSVIFNIGSLLCAVSTSSIFFILGRTVAGLGSSGLENGALTLVAGAVPLKKWPCKLQAAYRHTLNL